MARSSIDKATSEVESASADTAAKDAPIYKSSRAMGVSEILFIRQKALGHLFGSVSMELNDELLKKSSKASSKMLKNSMRAHNREQTRRKTTVKTETIDPNIDKIDNVKKESLKICLFDFSGSGCSKFKKKRCDAFHVCQLDTKGGELTNENYLRALMFTILREDDFYDSGTVLLIAKRLNKVQDVSALIGEVEAEMLLADRDATVIGNGASNNDSLFLPDRK